jgi:hypothetical protein
MRWPGVITPGQIINGQASLRDLIPTFVAAAGEPDLVEKMKTGYTIGDKTYKVHPRWLQPYALPVREGKRTSHARVSAMTEICSPFA